MGKRINILAAALLLASALVLCAFRATERERRIGLPPQAVQGWRAARQVAATSLAGLHELAAWMAAHPYDAAVRPLDDVTSLFFPHYTTGHALDPFPISMLDVFPGCDPLALRGGEPLAQQLVLAMGLLDDQQIQNVAGTLENAGFNLMAQAKGTRWAVFIPETVRPAFATNREVVIDPATGRGVAWPLIELEADLNIAAYRWRIYRIIDGRRVLLTDWPVVIGRITKRTPRAQLDFDVIEHYPPWTDPETREHRDPGPRNPLGIWKLLSTHNTDIWYFHGTNQESLLKRDVRAFSHGCIRNSNTNIERLALLLLSRDAGALRPDGLVSGALDVAGRKRTERTPLINEIPIRNAYDLIEVWQGANGPEIVFYPNIYRFDKENELVRLITREHLLSDLTAAGVDVATLDPAAIDAQVFLGRRVVKPTHVPVAALRVAGN